MKVTHFQDVPQQPVDMEGTRGCQVRWLVGEPEGAPTFAMRQFEVAPGGFTPHHSHPYEHEVYVLEGRGEVMDGGTPRPLWPGAVVYVAPNDVHQFRNTGDQPLKFLCLVPNSAGRSKIAMAAPECGANR